MKILCISVGDNGGGTWFTADAINKYTEHEARSVRFIQSWINYPFDIMAPNPQELADLIAWADVLHIRDNVPQEWKIPKNKPVVQTFTGMSYRRRAPQKARQGRDNGWIVTVSTPDLLSMTPAGLVRWMPNAREAMTPTKKRRKFTACHAPTFRERKGTDVMIAGAKMAGVNLDIVEDKPFLDCLELKSRAHCCLDQYIYGYGNNAIEAWAMGQPVISSAEKSQYIKYTRKQCGGALPYLWATTPQETKDALIKLRDDKVEYKRWCDTGVDYFYRFHHSPEVAKIAVGFYKEAMG